MFHQGRIWTPISIAVLVIVMGWAGSYVGYSVDREMKHNDANFQDIKAVIADFKSDNNIAHDKMWGAIISYQKRLDCGLQKVAVCCPDNGTVC